jgi:hypothetical protein
MVALSPCGFGSCPAHQEILDQKNSRRSLSRTIEFSLRSLLSSADDVHIFSEGGSLS